MMISKKKIGLYIHIPFCRRKCKYCDFYSMKKTAELEVKYINALCNEILLYKEKLKDYIVDTIFIGGGTPSYVDISSLETVLNTIYKTYNISSSAEISIESNPDSLDINKLINYRKMGINRLSIGVQSLDDDVLKIIGRLHDRSKALSAIDNAIKANFNNLNVDLMFNIPGQNLDNIADTVEIISSRDVKHISYYSLILEEKTVLYDDVLAGKIIVGDDENDREQYYLGRDIMRKNGFLQYEISNFSKKNYECKHNLRYWKGQEYIGFGPFSHSYFDNNRYHNIADINKYMMKFGEINLIKSDEMMDLNVIRNIDEKLNGKDKLFEYIMLRLRLIEGFKINEINEIFKIDFEIDFEKEINKLINTKLLIIDKKCVRLTCKGLDLSNQVFCEFMEKIY